jgi:uncharacterized membrane protein YagU involved in acid resistance
MSPVTEAMYEHEDRSARRREDDARGGQTAYQIAAGKAAALAGRELSERSRKRLGSAIHLGLALTAGAAYGLVRRRYPRVGAGAGLLYGAAFFLVVDEGANALLGLTPGPRAFPWQAHARGLLGHLTFGSASELTLRALERIAA